MFKNLFLLNKTYLNRLLVLVAAALLSQGCGKETVADQVTRQKDRERATAVAQLKESQSISGDYIGTGTVLEGPTYDVSAYIDTVVVNKDGTLVPQPSVTGSFTTYNRTRLNPKGGATKTVFPFSNGAFDRGMGTLAITIVGTNASPAIIVNCKVVDAVRLACLWHSLTSDLHFKFNLVKQ